MGYSPTAPPADPGSQCGKVKGVVPFPAVPSPRQHGSMDLLRQMGMEDPCGKWEAEGRLSIIARRRYQPVRFPLSAQASSSTRERATPMYASPDPPFYLALRGDDAPRLLVA